MVLKEVETYVYYKFWENPIEKSLENIWKEEEENLTTN